MRHVILLTFLLLSGCSWRPTSQAYRDYYCHLNKPIPVAPYMQETDYFLVVLVDARHLDYTHNARFFSTLAKHPSDGSKNSDVGHAWIYLRGKQDGKRVELEGGHSGETGVAQARYFEGITASALKGERNPIQYLWATQKDGFFESRNGAHRPTFAAKVDLTPEQFHEILAYIRNYRFEDYAITRNQCCTFAANVATLAGLSLDALVTMEIQPTLFIAGETTRLWTDPDFAEITFASPDALERSLIRAVLERKADYALNWYRERYPSRFKKDISKVYEDIRLFRHRYERWRSIKVG